MRAIVVIFAALFLATGAAHSTEIYHCGDVTVTLGARPKSIHIAFETAGFDSDEKPTTDVHDKIRWDRRWMFRGHAVPPTDARGNWIARLNGKRCKRED